ncbi:hypothetical protein RYX36_034434, partial [Vicia faba]
NKMNGNIVMASQQHVCHLFFQCIKRPDFSVPYRSIQVSEFTDVIAKDVIYDTSRIRSQNLSMLVNDAVEILSIITGVFARRGYHIQFYFFTAVFRKSSINFFETKVEAMSVRRI